MNILVIYTMERSESKIRFRDNSSICNRVFVQCHGTRVVWGLRGALRIITLDSEKLLQGDDLLLPSKIVFLYSL